MSLLLREQLVDETAVCGDLDGAPAGVEFMFRVDTQDAGTR